MQGYRMKRSELVTPSFKVDADHVWQIDDPAGTPGYVDITAAFNGGGSCSPWPASEAIGDQMAVGMAKRPRRFEFDLSAVLGIGGTMVVKYWNGTSLAEVATLVDDTTGFTIASVNDLSFDYPEDAVAQTINGKGPYFWTYFEVLTVYSTNPVLDGGQIYRGADVPLPAINSSGSWGALRMFFRNLDAVNDAYLTQPGHGDVSARLIAANGGTLMVDLLDHATAYLDPPEIYSENASPGNVLVSIDVAGQA